MSELVGNPEDRFSRVAAELFIPSNYWLLPRIKIRILSSEGFSEATKIIINGCISI